MNDSEFIKKLLPGDLICIRGESIIGKVIRWTTESNVNHVGMYIGNGLMIESTLGSGVRILPITLYLADPATQVFIARVKVPIDSDALIAKALTYFGSKYQLLGQIGILFKALVKKAGLSKYVTFWGTNKLNTDRVWCSEYMGYVFGSQNISFAPEDPSYLSPGDVYNSPIVEHINLI